FVGKVNEDFAVESMAGDIFLLGNHSWRIRRVESGRLRVEDAKGAPPSVPFWLGEAPPRTRELSQAVSDLRDGVASRLADRDAAVAWLEREAAVPRAGAEQIVEYIAATVRMLGVVPTVRTVVAERFFDESGGMQLVLHTPFGGRINRALGFTMRKRFCLTFDFELQAAATDDGVVLSLGEQHSFPLDSAFGMIRLATLREDLVQAMLVSPMFTNRWRWNATRALALLRYEGGRKVPMPLQRMRADDLLAAVFPSQVACQDNHAGPIEPPDHPLVNETILNCLHEAMDLNGLRDFVEAIGRGEIHAVTVDTPAPSPMSHEILNANPYAFLDDAPLEERRARAVSLRRLDDDLAGGMGALDPEAIATVMTQAWPDVRNADELHDFLLTVGLLRLDDTEPWLDYVEQLRQTRRAAIATWRAGEAQRRALVAVERLPAVEAALGRVDLDAPLSAPSGIGRPGEREAVEAMVQGWLEALGPVSVDALAERSSLPRSLVEIALAGLEGRGVVLRGRFTAAPGPNEVEWCDRRLLARIHRLTLGRLRREIEPVTAVEFIRFLLRWQHVAPATQMHGRDGLLEVIRQLQGVELPAPAWEQFALPGRVANYDAGDLEQLCLAGVVAWGRLSHREMPDEVRGVGRETRRATGAPRRPVSAPTRQAPTRQAPLAFVLREDLAGFLDDQQGAWSSADGLSREAQAVAAHLEQRGACFVTDLARGTGLMAAAVEEALWELVARGLVTGDGIAGLRVLLQPQHKRRAANGRLRLIRGGRVVPRLMPVGRWALWGGEASEMTPELKAECRAWQFLRRYGVVFRDLLAREAQAPPWRVLLGVYRRLEARGEIRGGRFVEGFVGEQYALPGAVDALRATRRLPLSGELVLLSSGDPLNLVGILTPGPRVSPFSKQVIAFRDGAPVDVGPLGAVRSRLRIAAAGSATV
ncbi:MAG: Lhr family helicase, partial [Vicinamibacteraceae bacterium]